MSKKVSPVKEKAIRFQKFLEESRELLKEKFGNVYVSNEIIAKELGYSSTRFCGIKNGNTNGKIIDKCAEKISEWTNGMMNADYVILGGKHKIKNFPDGRLSDDELEELPLVDMDDELEELEDMSDDLEKSPEKVEEAHKKSPEKVEEPATDMDRPKTAKEKWMEAAAALGVKKEDMNDDFMQVYCPKDECMHFFKKPSGSLPYRQEVMNVQAIGLGKADVINYNDDTAMYHVHFGVSFGGGLEVKASSADDARLKVERMIRDHKFVIGGAEFEVSVVDTKAVIVKE